MGKLTATNVVAGTLFGSQSWSANMTSNISDFEETVFSVKTTWIEVAQTDAIYVYLFNEGSNDALWRITDGTNYWRLFLGAGKYVCFPFDRLRTVLGTPSGVLTCHLYSALGTQVRVVKVR